MAVQKQDDQHEHTFSRYVRIRDVVLKTCLGRWTIGRSGERGSGISVLPVRHGDDDDTYSIVSSRLSSAYGYDSHFVAHFLSCVASRTLFRFEENIREYLSPGRINTERLLYAHSFYYILTRCLFFNYIRGVVLWMEKYAHIIHTCMSRCLGTNWLLTFCYNELTRI